MVLQNSLTKLNLNDPLLLEEIKLFVSTKLGTPIKVTKPAAITSTHETNNNQNLRTMESDSKQIGYGDPAEELTYTTMQSALLQESARKDPLK